MKWWMGLVVAVFFALAARADEPALWDLPQLMARMAQVESSQASFSEKKYLAVLTVPLELSGTLSYVRPGRLEKRVLEPYAERVEVDGDTLLVEKKNKRRSLALQNHPVIWAFVESMRATLAGDLPALQRFYRTRFTGGRENWLLVLEPLESGMAGYVERIAIEGEEQHVRRVEIVEAGGDRSVMSITENQ